MAVPARLRRAARISSLTGALLCLVLLPVGAAAPEAEWEGEWELVDTMDYVAYRLELIELDTSLEEFEAELKEPAAALYGKCRADGRFYLVETNYGSADNYEKPDGLACEMDESAAPRFRMAQAPLPDLLGAFHDPSYGEHWGPDEPPPTGASTGNLFGMVWLGEGECEFMGGMCINALGYEIHPTRYEGERVFAAQWTDFVAWIMTCESGPCLEGPVATAVEGAGGGGPSWVPLIAAMLGLGVVASAPVVVWARRRSAGGPGQGTEQPPDPCEAMLQAAEDVTRCAQELQYWAHQVQEKLRADQAELDNLWRLHSKLQRINRETWGNEFAGNFLTYVGRTAITIGLLHGAAIGGALKFAGSPVLGPEMAHWFLHFALEETVLITVKTGFAAKTDGFAVAKQEEELWAAYARVASNYVLRAKEFNAKQLELLEPLESQLQEMRWNFRLEWDRFQSYRRACLMRRKKPGYDFPRDRFPEPPTPASVDGILGPITPNLWVAPEVPLPPVDRFRRWWNVKLPIPATDPATVWEHHRGTGWMLRRDRTIPNPYAE